MPIGLIREFCCYEYNPAWQPGTTFRPLPLAAIVYSSYPFQLTRKKPFPSVNRLSASSTTSGRSNVCKHNRSRVASASLYFGSSSYNFRTKLRPLRRAIHRGRIAAHPTDITAPTHAKRRSCVAVPLWRRCRFHGRRLRTTTTTAYILRCYYYPAVTHTHTHTVDRFGRLKS